MTPVSLSKRDSIARRRREELVSGLVLLPLEQLLDDMQRQRFPRRTDERQPVAHQLALGLG
jgi:hypothetical protein